MNHHDLAKIFKALSDKNRVAIVELLKHGEMCASDMLSHLEISQPTLSHHMHILYEYGIVHGRRDGKWMRYSLNEEARLSIERFIAVQPPRNSDLS